MRTPAASVRAEPRPNRENLNGRRQFFHGSSLCLEGKKALPAFTLAYETWGELNAGRDNAILVLHALTGDSHLTGSASPGHPTPGWWSALVGPGAPIDTDKYFVVAPNVLGGCMGSTGPASPGLDGKPWGSRFPLVTIRDTVAAEAALSDHLGIEQWEAVIGGSLGGMRALEWAIMFPARVRRLGVIAATAEVTADQLAWAHAQMVAIELDPDFQGGDYYSSGPGPLRGLSLARQIAHTTYRSADELQQRFGARAQMGEDPWRRGRYAVQSYLEHQGEKLVARFDANTYRVLTRAFMTHDVGRGRGGTEAALRTITAKALIVAVDSDRLCPPSQMEVIAAQIPNAPGLEIVTSSVGHDGFLLEEDQLGAALNQLLSGNIE